MGRQFRGFKSWANTGETFVEETHLFSIFYAALNKLCGKTYCGQLDQ